MQYLVGVEQSVNQDGIQYKFPLFYMEVLGILVLATESKIAFTLTIVLLTH